MRILHLVDSLKIGGLEYVVYNLVTNLKGDVSVCCIDEKGVIGEKLEKKGIKVFSVAEVKKGKYEEILKRITEMQLAYSEIEGFKYKVETYLTGVDAMPMVGLRMPDL